MNPITHALTGWALVARSDLSRRDKTIIVLASVAPDADGLVLLGDIAAGRHADSLFLWSKYHHVLCHNIGFVLLFSMLAFFLAKRKWTTAALAVLAIHLHFLCDIIGGRGPEGYQWPIPYLLPFSNAWQLAVSWQWKLNAWPNILITIALLLYTFRVAWGRGESPIGLFSPRADELFVETLRTRFGKPGGS